MTAYRTSQVNVYFVDKSSKAWECLPQVIHRLHHWTILSSTSHNRRQSQSWDKYEPIDQESEIHRMSIPAFLRSLGASFRSTPALTLEDRWSRAVDPSHWDRAAVAVRHSLELTDWTRFCLCRAAHFAAIVEFSHELRSYP